MVARPRVIRAGAPLRGRAAAMVGLAAFAFAHAVAAPSADDALAERVAKAFERLDVAPADGVLAGSELEAVPGYDTDHDGKVTPREFLDGFTARKPAAKWERHQYRREGFSFEMPGQPEPLDSAGAASLQVAVEIGEPSILLVARVRDMPSRTAGKPELLFESVIDLLEKSEAEVLDRRPANLGLHSGSQVRARRSDGSVEIVRSVVVRRTVYELDVFLPPDPTPADRAIAKRFLDSLELIR